MIKIAICDDEELFADSIKKSIQKYAKIRNIECRISVFDSGEALLEQGTECKEFNIVFLDVEMAELNGIDTARELRKYSDDMFIAFVTAHADYSIEGYEVEAIRYILKDSATLEADIDKCMDAILNKMKRAADFVRFKFREGEREINIGNILYAESYRHVVRFILADKEAAAYTLYGRLDDVEEELREHDFVRIHKSILVNMRHIKSMRSGTLTLDDGRELSISKSKYMDAKSEYIKYRCGRN